MCGIFSYIYNLKNSDDDMNSYYDQTLLENFNRISKRGPDNTQCRMENNVFLGFHDLVLMILVKAVINL